MGKFDTLITNLNEASDLDYLDWDDSYHNWQLTIVNERDYHGDNFVNKVGVKNTTQGLTIYNMLAKANGWPKVTKKKMTRETWFNNTFSGYEFSGGGIVLRIHPKKEQN